VQNIARQDPREARNLVVVVVVEDPEMFRVVPEVTDVDEESRKPGGSKPNASLPAASRTAGASNGKRRNRSTTSISP
jgi:hypothetical protein